MKYDLGINGNLFGGRMMSFIDESAAIYVANKVRSKKVVTKLFNQVEFINPVKEGDIIEIFGGVDNVGNSSITVNLEAYRISVSNNKKVLVCKTSAVFVKVDEHGHKSNIPDYIKNQILTEITIKE